MFYKKLCGRHYRFILHSFALFCISFFLFHSVSLVFVKLCLFTCSWLSLFINLLNIFLHLFDVLFLSFFLSSSFLSFFLSPAISPDLSCIGLTYISHNFTCQCTLSSSFWTKPSLNQTDLCFDYLRKPPALLYTLNGLYLDPLCKDLFKNNEITLEWCQWWFLSVHVKSWDQI